MSRLEARGTSFGYDGRNVVEGLDLVVPDRKLTVLVGPNACGKSTLLRGMSRLLRPRHGSVLLDGRAIHQRPTREVAQTLGLLPQSPVAPDGILVSDLVARGRQPHQHWWSPWSEQDEDAVGTALLQAGVTDLVDRDVESLSGGQRQRVWVAMALAQRTDLLLLDEPTTYLDVAHQVEVLDLLTRLVRHGDRTVVAVLHDLNQATRYADHLVAMKDGRVVAEGAPDDVVDAGLVFDVFGLHSKVIECPVTGSPLVIPVPST
ncbi:MAG TPA: ABC transporter ATP-binding protein [Nocardioidaceae bacterium]|nr:ABC transporter ATP-binding protein [Nocardioidaceae bacterium]